MQAIRQIVASAAVASQEELLLMLRERGYEVTQATLSRDIKELKIVKVPDAVAGYRYTFQDVHHEVAMSPVPDASEGIWRTGIYSMEFTGSFAVVKVRPGYASAVAGLIDSSRFTEILGTIAGDDTVLLIMREGVERTAVIRALTTIIPNIQSRLIV